MTKEEKRFYKCTCGKGLITQTIETFESGNKKIGVFPCGHCLNRPHVFHLKNYEKEITNPNK